MMKTSGQTNALLGNLQPTNLLQKQKKKGLKKIQGFVLYSISRGDKCVLMPQYEAWRKFHLEKNL